MRKLIAAGALAALMVGGSVSLAVGDPGPNGKNNHGLCTAYFNGSENGQAHKHNAGPFVALEQAADDGNASTTQDVWDWCSDPANNPKGIGGNPTGP